MVEEICVALGRAGSEAELHAHISFFRERYARVSGLAYARYLEKPARLVGLHGLGQFTIAACMTGNELRAWAMVEPCLQLTAGISAFYTRTTGRPFPAEFVRPFEMGVKILVTLPRHIDSVPGLARSLGIRELAPAAPPARRARLPS